MDYKEYVDIQLGDRGSTFGTYIPECIEARHELLDSILPNLDKSKKILDLGCGDGVSLLWFRRNEFTNVVGIDLDEKKLEIARGLGYPVFNGDAHNLDKVPEESFDIVLASHCLEHMLYPDKVIAEMSRIIRKGGQLVVVVPYPEKYDPDNVSHVANSIIGMDIDDGGETISKFIQSHGQFKEISKEQNRSRQPEIRIKMEKI